MELDLPKDELTSKGPILITSSLALQVLLEFLTDQFIVGKMQLLCRAAYYKTVPRAFQFAVITPEREGGLFFNIGLKMNEKTHRFVSDAPFIFEGSSGKLSGEFLHVDINGCEFPDGWCRFIASEVEGGNFFDLKKNLIVFCYF
jgi:hypothetical protein